MKRLIATLIISAALFSACGTSSQAEEAGAAMAEMSCMLFSMEDIMSFDEADVNEALKNHGFENQEAMDEYIASIEGTTEMNEVAVSLRDNLTEMCGEELEALGVSPEDIYQDLLPE